MPTFDDLYTLLKDNYGFSMDYIETLDGCDGISWLVAAEQNGQCTKFVVKLAPVKGFVTELQHRQRVMQHLTDHGIACQVIVPTASGQLCFLHETPNGKVSYL